MKAMFEQRFSLQDNDLDCCIYSLILSDTQGPENLPKIR